MDRRQSSEPTKVTELTKEARAHQYTDLDNDIVTILNPKRLSGIDGEQIRLTRGDEEREGNVAWRR